MTRISVTRRPAVPVSPQRVALAVAVAVGLAACGGHSVTKQDVIARANQICETTASAVRAVAPPTSESLTALARYYERVTPLVAREAEELRALPRPAQDRGLLDHYLAAVSSSATEYAALAGAAQRGDRAALAGAGAALRVNPAAGLASRYGIAGCGASSGTAAS